ncbi:MAG: ferrous iron transport protein A [Methylocystaceae bacterium]|nr:ferrous iron transport protein A [Methylocystaceae bacterium]
MFHRFKNRPQHPADSKRHDGLSGSWFSLNDVEHAKEFKIKSIHSHGAIRQRLLDMGLVPGITVTVIRDAPLADPLEVRIGDSFISLRRTEAKQIEVHDDKQQ